MKNKLFYSCILILILFTINGCNKISSTETDNQDDIELATPEYTVEESEQESTETDYSDKLVEDGFWIDEIVDRSSTWYMYVPLMKQKIAGVYDLEDFEENLDYEYYGSYNRPNGTQFLTKQSSSFFTTFRTSPLLGYNEDESDLDVELNPAVSMAECFIPKYNAANIDSVQPSDISCVTFALYEGLYEDTPKINVQVYGITSTVWNEAMGDKQDWKSSTYRSLIESCTEQDYSNCTLLSEKMVSSSGIYYIDFDQLAKTGDYMQYLVVYRFEKRTSCAYCIYGNLTYNITDEQSYQAWKSEHLEQFLAGE